MSLLLGVRIYRHEAGGSDFHKIRSFPCTIGRALRNDITIDDETVSYIHCLIEKTEKGLVVRDLGSKNGLTADGKKFLDFSIENGSELYLGDVRLKFFQDEDEQDENEITTEVKDFSHHQTEVGQRTRTGFFIKLLFQIAAILALSAIHYYMDLGNNPKLASFFANSLTFIVFGLCVAAGLSIFSKLHNGRYRFFDLQYRIQNGLLVFIPAYTFWETLLFQFGPNLVRDLAEYCLAFGVMFFGGMQVAPVLFPRRLLNNLRVWVGGLSAFILLIVTAMGLVLSSEMVHYEFTGVVGYPFVGVSESSHPVDALDTSFSESVKEIEKERVEILEELKKRRASL